MVNFASKLKDPGTCRVFFSSPFGGMEDEREELTRKYFPQLQHFCNSRGVQFVAVDMRWGITSEAAENAQVINICLRELDRSDLFVGFFGQRYGWHGADDKLLQENFDNAVGRYPWLDNVRDRSVTELEFLYGHLNAPGHLPACILFRDKAHDDLRRKEGEKNENKSLVFKYSPESEHSTMLMDDLRTRVRATKDQALGVHMDYKTPQEGARLMFEAVWKHLTGYLLADSSNLQQSRHDLDLAQHDSFLASRCSLYLTDAPTMSVLDTALVSDNQSPILVTGVAGVGKSALLCNWVQKLMDLRENYLLVYHFVGCAESSTAIKNILRRLASALEHFVKSSLTSDNLHDQEDTPKTSQNDGTRELMRQLQVAVEKVMGLGKVPVIIIDGLEKVVSPSKIGKHLFWLPMTFPQGTVVVVSTQSTDTESMEELVENRKYQVLDIKPLQIETKQQLCVRTLKESGKELSPSQLQRVVDAAQTENPLFLKIVLSELCMFGYFRLLDKKIDSLISAESVEELFHQFLQRLEDDYNVKDYSGNLVEQVMCCICLSHQGMSEAELKELFDIPSHVWSPLFFAIEKFVVSYSGLLQYGFTELKEAVAKKYLQNEDTRKHYLEVLIKYFDDHRKKFVINDLRQPVTIRPTYELPWLQKELGDVKGLIESLSDMLIFSRMQEECEYDLLYFWKYTGCSPEEVADRLLSTFDVRIVETYLHMESQNLLGVNTPPGLNIESLLRIADNFMSLAGYQSGREKICKRHLKIMVSFPLQVSKATVFGVYNTSRIFLNILEITLVCIHTDSLNDSGVYFSLKLLQKCQAGKMFNMPRKKTMQNLEVGNRERQLKFDYEVSSKYLFIRSIGLMALRLEPMCASYTDIYTDTGGCILYFQKHVRSQRLQEEINFGHLPAIIGNLLTNIGLCYRRLGDLDEAEKKYKKSLEIKVNAVGQEHVIVAMAYLNLGTLEMYRSNWTKSEEYLEESIRICKACRISKTEENYLKVRENYLMVQLRLGRYSETVPMFLEVFEDLVKLNEMDHCLPYVHTEMVKFFINNQRHEEAMRVTWALMNSTVRGAINYVHLEHLDMLLPHGERPVRDRVYTLDYALEQWPGADTIVHRKAVFHLIPDGDVQGLVHLIEKFHEHSSYKTEAFNCGILWSSESQSDQKEEMIIQICRAALTHYPDLPVYIDNIMRSYRRQQKPSEALEYAIRLTELEQDNAQYYLIAGETAALAGDFVMSEKFFTQVQENFPNNEDAVQRAQKGLKIIAEAMREDVNGTDESTSNGMKNDEA
ncbi:hypothetical protein ScPMuIL_013763 [Solemya velum]